MRRGRVLIMVLLIVIIGLVVAYFAFSSLFSSTPEQPVSTNIEIYAAGQAIPQGGEITEEALKKVSIPQEAFVDVEYRVDELSLLLGKRAKYPIDQGVILTESMVGDSSSGIAISGPQWAAVIPAGQTAISIPTDRLGLVGYGVGDGAHVNINACFLFVDVDPAFQTILPNKFITLAGTGFTGDGLPILTLGATGPLDALSAPAQGRLELEPAIQQPYFLIPSEIQQRPRLVCQILLQNIVVLKVGNFGSTPAPAEGADPNAPADQQAQPQVGSPDLVTLLVSPQDSIVLSYLIQTKAKLTMTVRNPSDEARQATEASTLQFLLGQYNIPVPGKLPYALHPATNTLDSLILPTDVTQAPAQ